MDLPTMRTRVREDLQDTDAGNYRWTNDEVDGAIERVVEEFSLAYPLEQQDDIATTEGSREINISSLEKLIKVYSVEFPIGYKPRSYQRFEIWQTTLYMEEEGNGNDARVRWGSLHALDAAASSIPDQFEEVIVLGATGYLAASASVYTVDKATISGRYATANFLKWGQERLARYEKKLRSIGSRVSTRELYSD